jgi:hypothetical protein
MKERGERYEGKRRNWRLADSRLGLNVVNNNIIVK